jgi:hypothetical protein
MKRIIYLCIGAVLMVVIVTFQEPYFKAYQIKLIARTTCQDFTNEVKSKSPENQREAAARFPREVAANAGVKITKDQFQFESKPTAGVEWECICRGKVTMETSWFLVGDILGLEPVKTTHKVVAKKMILY